MFEFLLRRFTRFSRFTRSLINRGLYNRFSNLRFAQICAKSSKGINTLFTTIPPTLELKIRVTVHDVTPPLFELDFFPPNFGARDGKNRGNGLNIGQDRGKI